MDLSDRETLFRRVDVAGGLKIYRRQIIGEAFTTFLALGGQGAVEVSTIASAIIEGVLRLVARPGKSLEIEDAEATNIAMGAIWALPLSVPERNVVLEEIKRQLNGLAVGLAEHSTTLI